MCCLATGAKRSLANMDSMVLCLNVLLHRSSFIHNLINLPVVPICLNVNKAFHLHTTPGPGWGGVRKVGRVGSVGGALFWKAGLVETLTLLTLKSEKLWVVRFRTRANFKCRVNSSLFQTER